MALTLDREQQKVLSALLAQGQQIKDPRVRRIYERAAVETGLVESNLRNLSGGDADSAGWRQERASLYANPTNLTASARRFRQEFQQAYDPGEKSYQVAGQVQRPAAQYLGRYQDRAPDAAAILAQYGTGGAGGGGTASAPSSSTAPAVSPLTTDGGAGPSTDATALISLAAQQRQPIASSALPTPAALPDAYKALTSGGGPAAHQGISALIDAARTPADAATATMQPASAAPSTSGGGNAGSGRTSASGARISAKAVPGDPVVSSKQSVGGQHDTMGLAGYPAKDYFAPAGSHAVAPVTGTVIKLSGHDPKDGPTNGPHGPLGYSVYIKGADGRTYFMTHMGSRGVQVGDTVKQGQVIGTVANYDKYGTPSHIHMGVHG